MKEIWFKAKNFGWGWYPCTWQGWGILAMYIFLLARDVIYINNYSSPTSDSPIYFLLRIFILTTFLIIICYEKGEKPKWRWGGDDESNTQ